MANICNNLFYAHSKNKENLAVIKQFFTNWNYEGGADYEEDDEECNVTFQSKWYFPKVSMDDLFNSLPDKSSIYMRCLSYELSSHYHELYVCEGDYWATV